MSRDHRKLKAFMAADELVMCTYQCTKGFPRDEWFGLRSQMRRAALAIACNIVEGCARTSERDYVNFLNIALGSARELGYQISVATRLEYLTPDDAELLLTRQTSAARLIAGVMRGIGEHASTQSKPQAASLKSD